MQHTEQSRCTVYCEKNEVRFYKSGNSVNFPLSNNEAPSTCLHIFPPFVAEYFTTISDEDTMPFLPDNFYLWHFFLRHFYLCHSFLWHFNLCHFYHCHFFRCHYYRCHLYQCHFSIAIFTDAIFSFAIFSVAIFTIAIFSIAIFTMPFFPVPFLPRFDWDEITRIGWLLKRRRFAVYMLNTVLIL